MLTTEQIKQTVTDYFRDKPVKKVYLFGSYARGEATEKSDVDLLVDLDYTLDGGKNSGWDWFHWPDELTERFKRKVDVVSSGGLKPDRLFTRFVNEQKVLIYAKPA